MSNYTIITDFAAKDALPIGNPAKVGKGSEVTAELEAISTAIASKQEQVGTPSENLLLSSNSAGQVIEEATLRTADMWKYLDGDSETTYGAGVSELDYPSLFTTYKRVRIEFEGLKLDAVSASTKNFRVRLLDDSDVVLTSSKYTYRNTNWAGGTLDTNAGTLADDMLFLEGDMEDASADMGGSGFIEFSVNDARTSVLLTSQLNVNGDFYVASGRYADTGVTADGVRLTFEDATGGIGFLAVTKVFGR